MNKLLLTGFEPFLDFPVNPTMEIVEQLNGSIINGYEITGKVLSVDFASSGEQIIELIKKGQPDAVISLGVAGGRFKINPERIAINCNDGQKDNRGYKPSGQAIFDDGKDGIFTTLPVKDMVKQLIKAGLPASISNSAGTYLCNNVMYHALYHFEKNNESIPSGFIHIPASLELAIEQKNIPGWSIEDLTRAIRICIECL